MSYGASFGAVGFDVEIEPLGDDLDTEVSIRHIPGSNINYVDISGVLTNQRTYTLYFDDPNNYFALRNKVGTIDTLTDIDGTHVNTLLKSLKRQRRFQGGGQTLASAQFIVGS